MEKQVKINIKDKYYYCDMEVLELIERLQDKVELLEYNRNKAIEYINDFYEDNEEVIEQFSFEYSYKYILSILKRGTDNE